jgi:hypothetical protein
MYICNKWYVLYVLVDCQLAWFGYIEMHGQRNIKKYIMIIQAVWYAALRFLYMRPASQRTIAVVFPCLKGSGASHINEY